MTADQTTGTLKMLSHDVSSVGFGDTTSYENGRLTVSAAEAKACLENRALASTKLSWVSPGESARIIKVLDAVQPRTKGPDGSGIFPGFFGKALPQGRGETHVLRKTAVISAGYLPRLQEGLIQMSGAAAELSPFGSTHNLVVEFEPAEGAPWEEVDLALRRGILRLAATLAEAALDAPPDNVREVAPSVAPAPGDRPRVGTITNLQTQGSFKDVFVYGRSMSDSLPTAIDPNELEDGAVVSGQYGHPGLKNNTYLYQNHPIVAALRARDGKDLDFAGLVLSPEPVQQSEKELISEYAARLCAALGMDAVVVTKEGGGNADADNSLKADACEAMGITAVGIYGEMSGRDGTGPPLVSPPSKASAMVSTGNYDEMITVEAVERAVGGEVLDLTDQPASEEITLQTAVIYGSLNPLGWGRLTCWEEPAS
jgi:glycine reductase complex component B subunit alpha and beta